MVVRRLPYHHETRVRISAAQLGKRAVDRTRNQHATRSARQSAIRTYRKYVRIACAGPSGGIDTVHAVAKSLVQLCW